MKEGENCEAIGFIAFIKIICKDFSTVPSVLLKKWLC